MAKAKFGLNDILNAKRKAAWGKPASKYRQEKTEKGGSKGNKSPC